MIELVKLERRHEDFERRNVRVVVVSMEGLQDAQKTQAQFSHLVVLADEGRGLSQAVDLIHVHARSNGDDADTPTTILVDRGGIVRWVYRPAEVISRLSPDDILEALEKHLPKSP